MNVYVENPTLLPISGCVISILSNNLFPKKTGLLNLNYKLGRVIAIFHQINKGTKI